MGSTLMENPAIGSHAMVQRFQRIAKKVSGQNRHSSNPMGNVKYGVQIPRNVKEALEFDRINGDHQWCNAIIREIEALMGQDTFAYLNDNAKLLKGKGFKFCPLRMIFDIKQDGRRKARLVIGGHVLDSTDLDTYASVMKAISQRLLMVIALANDYQVLTGDIKNAYLYADCVIKVYTRVGPEFKIAGHKYLKEGSYAQIVKALYGLPTSGRNWHAHLAETLRGMGFRPTRYDPDVYIRRSKSHNGYDYLGCHTDDVTIVAKDAQSVLDQLKKSYKISKPGAPTYHLGCDYKMKAKEGKDRWMIGSATHVKEAIEKVE